LERWLHYHPTKTAGSGVIQITSNDDSVSSTRAVTRRGITATTGSFASISHTRRDLALKIPRRQLQICSLTRRGLVGFRQGKGARLAPLVEAHTARLQCSSCATLGRCWQLAVRARSASPFITSSAAVCFTSPLVLHFTPPTLRQQRLLARTSCQERISIVKAFSLPRLLTPSSKPSIYATRLATL
jgi:hypothetical protein